MTVQYHWNPNAPFLQRGVKKRCRTLINTFAKPLAKLVIGVPIGSAKHQLGNGIGEVIAIQQYNVQSGILKINKNHR